MSEAGLSSPPIATLSPLTVPSSTTPTPEPLNSMPERNFWVELRHATAEERNYEEFHLNLREIVAEHTEGSQEFYYVLLGDNKHHKIKAKFVREEYPGLLKDFERRAKRGLVKKFNPHGASVHPLSLPRLEDPSESSEDEYASEGFEESDQLEESDSDSDGFAPAARVRRLRSTTRLPFSPAKAPAKRRIHRRVQTSDSEDELAPARRSTRSTRNTRSYHDDDEYEDEERNEFNDAPSLPKKKRVRAKASRPAYGHFREVLDLELDDQSDDETLPLRAHRGECEKCRHPPSHILLKKLDRRRKKRGSSDNDEEDEEDEEERDNLESLGGWVRCLKCPVVMHWKCLNMEQRSEIRKAALERDMEEFERKFPLNPDGTRPEGARKPSRRTELGPHETTEFICIACMKGGSCIGCGEVALKPDPRLRSQDNKNADEDVTMEETQHPQEPGIPKELFFRCITCKRLSHYEHLPPPDHSDQSDWDAVSLAKHYSTDWLCGDCASFTYKVEKIIAWRPSPEGAPQPDEPNYKDPLPREYLIKWKDRSYKRVTWVPHMWILATHSLMLRHFTFGSGTKVTLMERPTVEGAQDPEPTIPIGDTRDSAPPVTFGDIIEDAPLPSANEGPAEAMPDAHLRIPPAWKTVDRVLDILLWRPKKGDDDAMKRQREIAFEFGEQPGDEYVSSLHSWEKATKSDLAEKDIHQVAYAFFKWNDLGYDDCSWDTPPRPGEFGYQSFKNAFKRFLDSRIVWIPRRRKQDARTFDDREKGSCPLVIKQTPALGQSPELKLMPFQVDGLKWLTQNWWDHQHCILADEMGLGKTIQIVTFIGLIIKKKKAAPCLVVVPNSTITSWVREFERWAPRLRVVPYYGEAKSREIVRRYELTHDVSETGYTNMKYHVLITTYETITNSRDFGPVFKQAPRWEALVVDEGQRLKNDSSLIFKKLTELHSVHRIIMTGTPLNNNIRELFNLLNFLDPDQWGDLKALEKQYEELTEELVKTLHTRLRPYFLRRIKAEVLQLPPKNEVIVPVSMTPLQKEIYRSILSQNLDVLKILSQPAIGTRSNKNNVTKTNLNNMLMQLRKCLQHPYLVNEGIEPKDLVPNEVHEKLVSASAKLILLRMMLPKLRERGHRVLLFSQFKLVLDIVEDFLDGERIKHLRLDGDTPSSLRQKGIDEFNRPGSDTFIYLLTTRAGGVGINLYTADTVIIFDPDFNPHQDLQAIARSHRYGQKKTCMVFKFMVKNSAEERIMQVGRKKLALDHVIVQKMDDELGEDVQSILTFGAQQLFQDEDTDRGITYSEADVQSLIERTEKEGDVLEETGQNQASAFSFAKVWAADKDILTEMDDANSERTEEVDDSWAQVLAKLEAERSKTRAQEVTGRGAKRKAAPSFLPERKLDVAIGSDGSSAENSPKQPRKNGKKLSDREDYNASAHSSDGGSESGTDANSVAPDEPFLNMVKKTRKRGLVGNLAEKFDEDYCGLCGTIHKDTCHMVQNADNLVEYRAMLMEVTNEEPIEARREAIQAIDEKLSKMGKLDLIKGQPVYLADNSRKRKKPHEPDQGENVVGHPEKPKKPRKPRKPRVTSIQTGLSEPWQILNRQPFANPLAPTVNPLISTVNPLISTFPTGPVFPPAPNFTMASGSSGLGPLFTTLRPPKKAKKSALVPAVDNVCPLCGGPKHNLGDCPAPKGGPKKVDELYRSLSVRPGGIDDFQTLSWLQKERGRLQALEEAARAGSSRPQPPANMDSV